MPNDRIKPPAFHVLLALAERERHGLGVADWVERTTGRSIELGPGTLYRTLKELLQQGLIAETDAPAGAADPRGADPRRKYYAITRSGRKCVSAEAARLERLVEVARANKLLPKRA